MASKIFEEESLLSSTQDTLNPSASKENLHEGLDEVDEVDEKGFMYMADFRAPRSWYSWKPIILHSIIFALYTLAFLYSWQGLQKKLVAEKNIVFCEPSLIPISNTANLPRSSLHWGKSGCRFPA
jgi:hypothetical protein